MPLLAFAVGMLLFSTACSSAESGVRWAVNLEAALKQAKESDKPVFVDVYADWCGPCKMLEKDVFPRPDVMKVLNEKFVPYRVNFEEDSAFADRYPVKAFPTLLLLEADGAVGGRIEGAPRGPQMVEALESMLAERQKRKAVESAVEKNPADASARYRLGLQLWESSEPEKAAEHLSKAIELDTERSYPEREKALFALGHAFGIQGKLEQGAKFFQQLMQEFPKSDQIHAVEFYYGAMQLELGHPDEAKRYLQKVQQAPSGSVPQEMLRMTERLLAGLK